MQDRCLLKVWVPTCVGMTEKGSIERIETTQSYSPSTLANTNPRADANHWHGR